MSSCPNVETPQPDSLEAKPSKILFSLIEKNFRGRVKERVLDKNYQTIIGLKKEILLVPGKILIIKTRNYLLNQMSGSLQSIMAIHLWKKNTQG
jgi:hypothetical protein